MTLRPGVTPKWGPLTLSDNRAWDIGQVGPFGPDGQRSAVILKLMVAGYVQPANATDPNSDNECYVVVDLAGSEVSPGGLGADDDENRGFYTHAIDIRMSLVSLMSLVSQPIGLQPIDLLGTGTVDPGPEEAASGDDGDHPDQAQQWVVDADMPTTSAATGSGSVSSGSSGSAGFSALR